MYDLVSTCHVFRSTHLDGSSLISPSFKCIVGLIVEDTTLNVMPTAGGKLLMGLTDGGFQYLLVSPLGLGGVFPPFPPVCLSGRQAADSRPLALPPSRPLALLTWKTALGRCPRQRRREGWAAARHPPD